MSTDDMSKNIILSDRATFFIGALLVVLGTFLPWECYRGFIHYCPAGIIFVNIHELTHYNSDALVMMLMLSIGGSLIISGVVAIRQWFWETISLFVTSVIFYFSIKGGFVYDNGGLIVVLFTCISLWSVLRLSRFTQHAYLVTTISTLLLVSVLIVKIGWILLQQINQAGRYSGWSFKIGLPVALIGAILMFITRPIRTSDGEQVERI